jgi:PAS domain S-box-containing protein
LGRRRFSDAGEHGESRRWRSAAIFRKALPELALGVVIVTPERIVDANDAFLRMTGYTHDEVLECSIEWKN